ncbi:hypothetical protein VHEMI04669 [[Torrubiella] hemipterigena]|uniref:Amidase domain-containing protein n=1 Tax=[Torrubiella] hemipterigena TaxID=1531966 RepID=A0A0A1TF13_9HYPO|nr:hypothetical protein VHEMI04669 [[Torrubiella] hemipterigena]
MPGVKKVSGLWDRLGAAFVPNIAAYLKELEVNPNKVTNLRELIEFNKKDKRENVKDNRRWEDALALGYDNTSPRFHDAGPEGFTGAIEKHKLDFILAEMQILAYATPYIGGPAMAVPMKTQGKHPVALGITGPLFGEEKMIQVAYAYEQKTMAQRDKKPTNMPKTELKDVM